MSSEDVIELGSSDEETEPAPKKSKPMPNAMVCIPQKIRDPTIKRSEKSNLNSITKGLGKGITVKKVLNNKSVGTNKIKVINGKSVQQLSSKISFNPFADPTKKFALIPIIPMKPSNSKGPIVFNPKPGSNKRLTLLKGGHTLKTPIKIQTIPVAPPLKLPPSITIKKTSFNKPVVQINVKNKPQMINPLDVLTVELDDDEVPTPDNSSPQWYMPPIDPTESSTLEEQNNKEPDAPKFIEITIEDSPVKPVINKNPHTVGAELSITIEDSPVKTVVPTKPSSGSESDKESDRTYVKTPRSKKQLEYPKHSQNMETVEIEIEPLSLPDIYSQNKINEATTSLDNHDKPNKKLSNENSECENTNKDSKRKSDPPVPKDKKIESLISDLTEFHPVYRNFIQLCFKLENSEDMKTIVDKKIKGYYKQVPKEYTESEEFIDMVSSKILSMKAGPEKMYLYIKDIVDELNLQRKLAKANPVAKETKAEEPEIIQEVSEPDSKRQRQVRKLEKTIKKLHRAIQKLEEQEVDFDDEDDSVYLLTERYKERMVRVYTKFCQLSNTKMPSEPRILIESRPGLPTGPAKRLEKWINKKVPIGTPLPFPDFHDVLRCVRDANEEDRLNYNEADVMEEARDLFTRCGKKLQRRRQENEWRLAASRLALDVDPAEESEELKRKLSDNRKVAAQKETEIFNRYADRQNLLKLEGVEIGDKEAEESPVESEEEETNEESVSLENTEKRKERLKRLIHQKSKKLIVAKENHLNKENGNTTDKSSDIAKANVDQITKDDQSPDIVIENISEKSSNDKCPETIVANVDQQATINKTPERPLPDVEQQSANVANPDTATANEEQNISNHKNSDKNIELDIASKATQESNEVEKQIESNANDEVQDFDKKKNVDNSTETFTLSDDSNDLESDIDELHLLQKLHSGNEDETSTEESSDSESPIAISDSLESSDDFKKNINDDIISIENSSYSESETGEVDDSHVELINDDNNAMEVDINNPELKQEDTVASGHNSEYNETVENILLASSEDDNFIDSQEENTNDACVNLKDELISIDETIIGNVPNNVINDPLLDNRSESNTVGVNIDINVISTNHKQVTETEQPKLDTQAKSIENIANNDISVQSVEFMDTDNDDTVINES